MGGGGGGGGGAYQVVPALSAVQLQVRCQLIQQLLKAQHHGGEEGGVTGHQRFVRLSTLPKHLRGGRG